MRHLNRTARRRCALLLLIPLILACQDEGASVPQQIAAVERARTDLDQERQRLEAMRGSLEVKVAENIEIGLPLDRARSLEIALIRSQEALVKASKLHHEAQTNLLKQMQGK